VRHDGGLNGAQQVLLISARHFDIAQVNAKVTPRQPTPSSHRPLLIAGLSFLTGLKLLDRI
jgi:hypothetical protein